jgi:hypothetical protein
MSAGRIAGALLTVALLAACTSTPGKEAPTLGPNEFSRLDDAGIAQIREHRFARFDLRHGTLRPQDVGLPADPAGTIIGDPSKPEITVELVGPVATETITTRTLDVMPGERTATITFFRDPVDRDAAAALLRTERTVWGIRAQDVDTWLAAIADPAVGRGERYKSVIGDGVGRSGLVASVEAAVKDGVETHQVFVNLGSYLYTPEALGIIRSTGSVVGVRGPA